MQLGFFISGVAGQMAQYKMDNISHNLANASTAGYMEDRTAFSSMFSNKMGRDGVPDQTSASYITLNSQYVSTTAGTIRHTGNNLDFAIRGNAFFRVQMPDGTEALTRAGNFKLGAEGQLMTQGDLPVLDESGQAIKLPMGKISVTKDGSIYVDNNANDSVPSEQVAKLGLSSIKDERQLQKVAGVLIRTPKENISEISGDIEVHQGSLQGSNVNSIMAMAEMVDTMRSYQATMKIVEQFNQQAGQLNDRVGTVQG